MVDGGPQRFYVRIVREKKLIREYRVSPNLSDLLLETTSSAGKTISKTNETILRSETFRHILDMFSQSMRMYLNFVPMTLFIGPILSSTITEERIVQFAESKGLKRADLSGEDIAIYELDLEHMREFLIHVDEVVAASRASEHIPNVMVIGLISSYDHFLFQLIELILTKSLKSYSHQNERYYIAS